MQPKARREGVACEQAGDGVRLTTPDGAVVDLPPLTAAVWRAADGATDLDGLLAAARAVAPEADEETVWSALDALADAGLLSGRAAPPAAAAPDRRTAIRTLAVAAGAAIALLPRWSEAREKAPAAGVRISEEKHKGLVRSEEAAKSELTAVTVRAKEQDEKLKAAPEAERGALRAKEEAVKKEVSAARQKSQEQMDKLTAARKAGGEQQEY